MICAVYVGLSLKHNHLFFYCEFSTKLLTCTFFWIGIQYGRRTLQQSLSWVRRSYRGSRLRKQILYTALAAVVYQIWRERNEAFWNLKIRKIKCIEKEIHCIVKHRSRIGDSSKWSSKDREWIENL